MVALYSTWVLLLIVVLALFQLGKKDFISPSFLVSAVFFASFTIVVANIDNWDIRIHGFSWKTTICILTAIFSFSIGSIAVSMLSNRQRINQKRVDRLIVLHSYGYPYILFAITSTILFVLFVGFKIKELSFSSLIEFVNALNDNYSSEKEYNFFTTQILESLVGLAYINFHRVMVEKYYLKKKVNKYLYIPIFLFLFGILLYTDRNIFLRFMIYALAAFIMSYNWMGINNKNNIRLFFKIGIAIVVIAIVFWIYGRLKKYTSNLERMIGIYAGSGIYGFNLWLKDFNEQFTYGEYTFSSIINSLSAIGIGSGTSASQYWEYIIYEAQNGYVFATNIYSALRMYYQDFGLIGIAIISNIMGIIFEILYYAAVNKKYGFWWFFYCAHIYHILYFPILEQFLLRFHFGLVYEVFWLWFYYCLIYSKYGLWRVIGKKIRIKRIRLTNAN